jgi:hypothetical protein
LRARILQLGSFVVLLAGIALAEQPKVKAPPPPRNGNPVPRPAVPRAGAPPRMGPRIVNPASPAARLYRATPEERDRVIEKLPAAQQERIRKQLEYFDKLNKDQQQIMIERTERLDAMPPEKRRAFQQQMQRIQRLAPERRQAVAQALRRLQIMSEAQRVMVLNGDQFKTQFSPEEQKIIADLSEVMLPPM